MAKSAYITLYYILSVYKQLRQTAVLSAVTPCIPDGETKNGARDRERKNGMSERERESEVPVVAQMFRRPEGRGCFVCARRSRARVFGRPEPTVTTTMFTRPARQGCPKRRAEGSRRPAFGRRRGENRYDLPPVNANFIMRAHEWGDVRVPRVERAPYIIIVV